MVRPFLTFIAPALVGALTVGAGAAAASPVDSEHGQAMASTPQGAQQLADQRQDDDDRRSHGKPPQFRYPLHHGPQYHVPPDRIRHYHGVVVVRPYGHWYPGYGHYRRDDDAFMWLSFTAITLRILDLLSEQQQRALETAQIRATTAALGETITWNDGTASGAVAAVREGTSSAGRYCREFQQTVSIGGRTEQAYGTACRQPDGAWEVVSTGN